MKATIDKEGFLKISPETELEAYAIGQWILTNEIDYKNVNIKLYWNIESELNGSDV